MAEKPGEAECWKAAVASSDGKNVDRHFGKASLFYLIEIHPVSRSFRYLGFCPVTPFSGRKDAGEAESRRKELQRSLTGCRYVLAQRFGFHARKELSDLGIEPFEVQGSLKEAVDYFCRNRELRLLLANWPQSEDHLNCNHPNRYNQKR